MPGQVSHPLCMTSHFDGAMFHLVERYPCSFSFGVNDRDILKSMVRLIYHLGTLTCSMQLATHTYQILQAQLPV